MKKVLFIDNTAHHMYGQLHNINAIRDAGYDVELLIPNDGIYFNKLEQLNYKCIGDLKTWSGMNPFQELFLFLKLRKLIKLLNPRVICSFTIKPNLYTAIITKDQCAIKQVANITGLGYAFMESGLRSKLFKMLYKYALKNISQIFFQNGDDYKLLKNYNLLSKSVKCDILPGSGVNLNQYRYMPRYNASNSYCFLYSGRLLADKGLYELIDAVKIVKKTHQIRLIIIGNYFYDNPSAISKEQIALWENEGLIEYLGMVDNVLDYIIDCDCLILPSHREGMPRSILEASSVGRPVITVNSAGCRDAVDDGLTGFIAHVKDAQSIANMMIRFIELPNEQKLEMGVAGRRKMEKEFDQQVVVEKYLSVVNDLIK
jgi:glycosyltransferase involved in cell wall biosynthesis